MAVGITTTDGKDLDDRYIRTLNGSGPDENGNVVAPTPPVTSVQGQTGDVQLRISTNSNPITASATPGNNSTYSYTVPQDVLGNLYITAGTGRIRVTHGGGEEEVSYTYEPDGNTRLWVKINGTEVFNKTTSKGSTTYSPAARYFLKGDVIEMNCYRSRNDYVVSHSFSFRADPTIII